MSYRSSTPTRSSTTTDTPARASSRTSGRTPHPMRDSLLLYAGVGLAWGVAARIYMRLISDDPGFTLTGTGMILGFALLWFTGLGAVRGARLSRRRWWWWLAPVPGLVLFAGLGMVYLPLVVCGLVAGRQPKRWRQVMLALVGLAVMLLPFVFDLTTYSAQEYAGGLLYLATGVALFVAVQEWSCD